VAYPCIQLGGSRQASEIAFTTGNAPYKDRVAFP
jgi:hypothetical protein